MAFNRRMAGQVAIVARSRRDPRPGTAEVVITPAALLPPCNRIPAAAGAHRTPPYGAQREGTVRIRTL